jgi:hypothetical protein
MDSCRTAWQAGKDEPRFARQTVLRAVYMPETDGGLPSGKEYDATRKAAQDFVAECKARNEKESATKQANRTAESERRNAKQEAANRKAIARKAAQAATGQTATVDAAQLATVPA